ncbi:Tim44 domain-containing protein [Rhodocyclus tenuis]|uniref:Tim44 domain-containing protein n=1 Tax=Rhodocyclus tenuis TaxID=1066 RepID=UPI001907262E|nr:TIM44-like domain-containing protein [Rhodocyclus tenuis]MBK1681487.1 transporter [Rhodocyclus tenuis]
MRKFLLVLSVVTLSLGLTITDAEAKRLGGGKSLGMQRESATQRAATPPEAPRNATAPAAAPAPAAAGAAPKRNWLGPIAGLAAGLGLAALASHFGFGEELANFLMIALLAMAAIFVVRLLMRRSKPAPAAEPLRYAGAGNGGNSVGGIPAAERFDAPLGGSSAAPAASLAPAIPADFDAEGFLRIAKLNFVRLQAANDTGNIADLREFLSPELFAETKLEIEERGGAQQQTDVVTLEARLLEVVTEREQHVASVRFTGMIREEADGAAQPFDEVWNLSKPVSGERGWSVAGIQQLS